MATLLAGRRVLRRPILANPPAQQPIAPAPTEPPIAVADPLPVELPRDDGPHDRLTEWWYYTGHLRDDDGGRCGLRVRHLPRRARRVPGVVGVAPRADRRDGRHASITPSAARSGRRSTDRPSPTRRAHRLRPRDRRGGSRPTARRSRAAVDDGRLGRHRPARGDPLGRRGDSGRPRRPDPRARPRRRRSRPPSTTRDGWIDFGPAGGSYYYSRTAMTASGSLDLAASGRSTSRASRWFDHQWGDFISVGGGGWDWFAVNLDDGTDLTLSLVRDADGSYPLVLRDARRRRRAEPAPAAATRSRSRSRTTGRARTPARRYPAGWRVSVPGEDLDDRARADRRRPGARHARDDRRRLLGGLAGRSRATRGGATLGGEALRRADRLRRGPGRTLTAASGPLDGLAADPGNTAAMRLELTRRGDYAVRAMLSLAAHDGDGWLSVAAHQRARWTSRSGSCRTC